MTDYRDHLPLVLLAKMSNVASEQEGIAHYLMPIPRVTEHILLPGPIGIHNITYEVTEVIYTPNNPDHAAVVYVKELG